MADVARTVRPVETSGAKLIRQRRRNLWRKRTNLRTGSERLRGVGPAVVAQRMLRSSLAQSWKLPAWPSTHRCIGDIGNENLRQHHFDDGCVVIFWVFMAPRPADAARIRCESSWEICAQRGKGPGLSHPIIRDNIRRGLDRPEQRQQPR
jgi:hypothetical protein